MKVFFLIDECTGGGVETVVYDLVHEMQKKNPSIKILHTSTDIPSYLNNDLFVSLRKSRIGWFCDLYGILKHQNCVIFSNMKHINVKLGILCILMFRFKQDYFVEHTHTNTSLRHETFWKRALLKFLIPIVYKLIPKKIVCVSNGVGNGLEKYFRIRNKDIEVIHNGFRGVVKPIIKDSQVTKGTSFLFIGRLTEAKNLGFLLHTFAEYNKECPEATLRIIGDGPQKNKLVRIASDLNILHNVMFDGFIPNPFGSLTQNYCFILPSLWEGFGNVIVEALHHGLPVIASNCESGPAEILGDGQFGYLFDVNNKCQLIDLMRKYKSDGLVSSQNRALDFSIEEAAKKYNRILKQ